MLNVSGGRGPAFQGKIYVYSLKNDTPLFVKEMPSPKYIDEKGFNGDERRVNSLIKALNNPDGKVKPLGIINADTLSCRLQVTGNETLTAQGKPGNRVLSMVLKDDCRKQMFNWILNPDKDISTAVRDNLNAALKNCLTKLQNNKVD